MAAQEARRPEAVGEVERLRRELAAVRQQWEDEVAYYRAQAETTRQRLEADQLKLHAQEVARRREVENDLQRVRVELREVREQSERQQRRYEELNRQYLQQEESARLSAEEQVTHVRATAREAWQSAEEELAAMEKDLSEARRALTEEQERTRQLEETLGSLQGLDGEGDEDRQEALLEEITALKKALNISERGREQAHKRNVRLAEKLVAMQAERSDAQASDQQQAPSGAAERAYRSPGAGNPVAVDLSEADAVLKAAHSANDSAVEAEPADDSSQPSPFGAELSDEFRLIQADNSLDQRKLERLQAQVEEDERRESERQRQAAAQRKSTLFTSKGVQPPDRPPSASGPAERGAGADAGHRAPASEQPGSTPRRWPVATGLVVALAGLTVGGAWFFGLLP